MEAGTLPFLLPSLADVPSLHIPFIPSATRTSLPRATCGFALYSAASLGNWKSITSPLCGGEKRAPAPAPARLEMLAQGLQVHRDYRGLGESQMHRVRHKMRK